MTQQSLGSKEVGSQDDETIFLQVQSASGSGSTGMMKNVSLHFTRQPF